MSNSSRPFNQPIELGLRALFILQAVAPKPIDLQNILFLDYALIHSSDIQGGPESLHPATPYRTGEWLAHRRGLEQGLSMFAAKELVEITFTQDGIYYLASPLTKLFLQNLESNYSKALLKRTEWLVATFDNVTTEDMSKMMLSNISVWGSEFKRQIASGENFRIGNERIQD